MDEFHYHFLWVALTDTSSTMLRPYLEDECWDWDTLLRIASDELILPLLNDRLVNVLDRQPSAIRDVLRAARYLHAERNEIVLDELRIVAGLANQIAIEPVVLKGGAHLLTNLYAVTSDRFLIDIDLLIPEPLVPALADHLLKNGYTFTDGAVGVDCHHETGLNRPNRPVVELHRSLGMGRARGLLPAAGVIRDSVPIRHRGPTVRLPSVEHLLLHHAIHAQLNNSYQRAIWPSLREAYDCHLLVARLAESRRGFGVGDSIHDSGIVALQLRTIQEMTGKSGPLPPPGMLTAAGLQWLHRRLLQAAPQLRFIDPYYLLRSSLLPRFYRIGDLVRSRNGVSYVLQTPFRRSFYQNIFKELF